MDQWDVVVVGAGNAGLSAAIAAREAGARVLVLERAPEASRGGNSRFTAGGFRLPYRDGDDLRRVMPDLTEDEERNRFADPYPPEAFFDDLATVGGHRGDPELLERLADQSLDAAEWLRGHGVRFLPMAGWKRLSIQAAGGGEGLVHSLFTRAGELGIDIWYETRATGLDYDRGRIQRLKVLREGSTETLGCSAVVLAAGGFQANAAWRTQYLGRGWDLAKVRGTWCNTGDGIAMALEVGAQPFGNWSGAHSVAWDRNAPDYGDLRVGDGFQKHSYPIGIVVNADGRRFLDEGADFLDYTYARYGEEILRQPQQIAWQVFDAEQSSKLREEYRIRAVSRVVGNTLPELARRMEGIDEATFLRTVAEFNASVDESIPLDLTTRDGRRADADVPKSNWADPVETGPFEAYAVTCGITFTFGGVRVDTDSRVLAYDGKPIRGLYAAGEMAAGTFYFNYPGGSGLTKGVVEGRSAGVNAAQEPASVSVPV